MVERKYPNATDPNREVDRFANNLANVSWYADNLSIVFSVVRPIAGEIRTEIMEQVVVARLVITPDLAQVLGETLLAAVQGKVQKPPQH